jgi:hypothetical protein
MTGRDIAQRVQERTGYSTEAWETGDRWTIVVRIDESREAWAEGSGFWGVHLRRSRDSLPYASQPTSVPVTSDDPDVIAAEIQAALERLLAEAELSDG